MVREDSITFEPRGIPTGIGSLPHADPAEAVRQVLRFVPEGPFWPQLPNRSLLEGMTRQYAAGLPGLREDETSTVLDTGEGGQRALEEYYARVLSDDPDVGPLDPERAAGFTAFLETLKRAPPEERRLVKGHVTGPVTLVSSLKDPEGREITHNPSFREAVAEHLARNARWQARCLGTFDVPVVIFLDEPVMEVYGSAYSTLDAATVSSLWGPVLDAVAAAGALSGIHCCGNTDWRLLFTCGADIVNFDAHDYLDKVVLYAAEAESFLRNGGILAWGVVPTDERVREEDAASLAERLQDGVRRFAAAGIDEALLFRRSLVTPSCGMGSLSPDLAETVLARLAETSRLFRAWGERR